MLDKLFMLSFTHASFMFVICYTPRTSRTLVKSSMLNENKLLKQLTDFAWQSVYDD